jgi:GntR family transcriptional regulator
MPERYGRFVTREALGKNSLYEILRSHNIVPDRATESFHASALGRRDAELLGMKKGDAVLKVIRKTECESRHIEYNYRYYVPDRYIYRIVLTVN